METSARDRFLARPIVEVGEAFHSKEDFAQCQFSFFRGRPKDCLASWVEIQGG
jgi:hypothetical protein